jgi:hypothetical protein
MTMIRSLVLASALGASLATGASATNYGPAIPTPANPFPANPVATNGTPLHHGWAPRGRPMTEADDRGERDAFNDQGPIFDRAYNWTNL